MCDYTTIDPSTDVRANDAIRRTRVDENAILHFNENHKWYIMRDHSEEDLLVFRNSDSLGKRARKLTPRHKHRAKHLGYRVGKANVFQSGLSLLGV